MDLNTDYEDIRYEIEDGREAVRAIFEKRKPEFTGR